MLHSVRDRGLCRVEWGDECVLVKGAIASGIELASVVDILHKLVLMVYISMGHGRKHLVVARLQHLVLQNLIERGEDEVVSDDVATTLGCC